MPGLVLAVHKDPWFGSKISKIDENRLYHIRRKSPSKI